MIHQGSKQDPDQRLVAVRPSPRQVAHQSLEFYAFIHFTVNTFTDREWGDGTESPACFNPSALDAGQWAETAKAGGMRGLILTCKHHDGFCLWPTAVTAHSVKASPWKDGRGDVVRETAEACARRGLKFGIYLSPWDRNHPLYGTGDAYNDFFVAQLRELLTQYGTIFTVWFDGACGEGPNGKRQHYDWERYYRVIRELQPEACIAVCGPDVRWCGNEAGDTRPSEWSVVASRLSKAETVEGKSQNADDSEFRSRKIRSEDQDLGSRGMLRDEPELIWYPAEVNTSVRPGWFYHSSEDDKVRSFEELRDIYLKSVGGNATFLLNLPPDRRGLIHENDVCVVKQLGDFIRSTFEHNLLEQAVLEADVPAARNTDLNVLLKKNMQFWSPAEGVRTVTFRATWDTPVEVRWVVLQEDILQGQRIESFEVSDDTGTVCGRGTTVGYRKILQLEQCVCTRELRIHITDARVCPVIRFLGAYA